MHGVMYVLIYIMFIGNEMVKKIKQQHKLQWIDNFISVR